MMCSHKLKGSLRAVLCGMIVSFLMLAACADRREVTDLQSKQVSNSEMFSESAAYERFMGRWSRLLAPAFVDFAGLEDGDSVLDVGSGTGALASAVLSKSASSHVVGIDPSSAYVEYAHAQSASIRVSFEVGDAQKLRFKDASFDRVLSLLVLNFIPDPDKALDEMVRVTRPRGVVAAAVWDYNEGMEMLRVFWDEAVSLDGAAEPRDERNMHFCRPGELEVLWREHGLGEVREEALVIALKFESFDDFWQPFLAGQGPAGAYVKSLNPAARAKLEEKLRQRLEPASSAGTIELSARAWVVRGIVPRQ